LCSLIPLVAANGRKNYCWPMDAGQADQDADGSDTASQDSACIDCGQRSSLAARFGIFVFCILSVAVLVGIPALEYFNMDLWGDEHGRKGDRESRPRRPMGESLPCKFRTISRGTCADFGWVQIKSLDACRAIAEELGLKFRLADGVGIPFGCYVDRDYPAASLQVWLGVSAASQGLGVDSFIQTRGELRRLLCMPFSGAATMATEVAATVVAAENTTNAPRYLGRTDATTQLVVGPSHFRSRTSRCSLDLNSTDESIQLRLARLATIPAGAFPEVNYIYVPESTHDIRRLKRMRDEMDRYVNGGSQLLRLVEGVYPALWPKSGRYDVVERLGRTLPRREQKDLDSPRKWPSSRNLLYATVDSNGRSTCPHYKNCHHVGCGLSHFRTWMEARQRGLRAILIAESDGFPSRFQQLSGGDAQDFAGIVSMLLQQAPEDWHLIQLDKGTFGVKLGRHPMKRLKQAHWSRPYDVYRWTGEGVAGLALYLVSRRFLEQVPRMIHDHGFDMVDAYIDLRCNSSLNCYSIRGVHDGVSEVVALQK